MILFVHFSALLKTMYIKEKYCNKQFTLYVHSILRKRLERLFGLKICKRKGKFSLANSVELSTKLPAGLNLSTIVTKCWKHLTRLIYCWCASRKAEQTCPYFQLLFPKCFDFLCARKAKRLMETKQKVIKH